jgi:hypothetical protein
VMIPRIKTLLCDEKVVLDECSVQRLDNRVRAKTKE